MRQLLLSLWQWGSWTWPIDLSDTRAWQFRTKELGIRAWRYLRIKILRLTFNIQGKIRLRWTFAFHLWVKENEQKIKFLACFEEEIPESSLCWLEIINHNVAMSDPLGSTEHDLLLTTNKHDLQYNDWLCLTMKELDLIEQFLIFLFILIEQVVTN